jgi:SRSO17 transposase
VVVCSVGGDGGGKSRSSIEVIPDILSIAAEDMLADACWQNISWRTGTKGKLKARFAAVRVRIDGPPQLIRDKGQQHLPGDEGRTGVNPLTVNRT